MNSETILDAYRACIAHAAPRGGMHPALALALDYAGVSFAELTDCTIEYGGGLYEIRFPPRGYTITSLQTCSPAPSPAFLRNRS